MSKSNFTVSYQPFRLMETAPASGFGFPIQGGTMPEKCSVRGYRGIRAPKCCGGTGCKACWKTYRKREAEQAK